MAFTAAVSSTAFDFEDDLRYLSVTSGEGSTWFDNIRVSAWTGQYSVQPAVTDIILGETSTVAVPAFGAPTWFRLEVPADGRLKVQVTGPSGAVLGVYARQGALPSRETYDARTNAEGAPAQQLAVFDARPGTWYLAVYGNGSTGQVTVTSTLRTGLWISGVTPTQHANQGLGSIGITGSSLHLSDSVRLEGGGHTFPALDLNRLDGRFLAEFKLFSIPPGSYNLVIASGAASARFPFTVVPATAPQLEARLHTPTRLSPSSHETLWVEIRNAGPTQVAVRLQEVTATLDGRKGAKLTLDSTRVVQGFWSSAETPAGFSDTVSFLPFGSVPGLLQPGETVRVPVYYTGWLGGWSGGLWRSGAQIRFELNLLRPDDPDVH